MKGLLNKKLIGVAIKWWILGAIAVVFAGTMLSVREESSSEQADTNIENQRTTPFSSIVFSDEQASAFLLVVNDFPAGWTAEKNGMFLDAEFANPSTGKEKKIEITLETHETAVAAQTAFFTKKAVAQLTIDDRGIAGGATVEEIEDYPLFIWNASMSWYSAGVETWTVNGVYGNITVVVINEGSLREPDKNFAVDIAKKQIDRIMGD